MRRHSKSLFAIALVAAATASLGRTAAFAVQDPLAFDPARYTVLRVTVDGAPMEVRRYRVVYVARPVETSSDPVARGTGPRGGGAPAGAPEGRGGAGPAGAPAAPRPVDPHAYQSMFIYVPARAYADADAAIVLHVNNSGWFASPATDRITDAAAFVSTSDTDPIGAALQAGYVVVSAGTRSRGVKATDGSWAGKAPAAVVDAKAAIRYLRLNDDTMPGSAERIVITGTSGGGALSVAVAASGNSPDYYPYLAAIGAAGIDAAGRSTIRDDVFATVAYCPITDLGHADLAYEWQYHAVRAASNTTGGQYSEVMQRASAAQAAAYPAYLEGLGLRRQNGTPLTAAGMPEVLVAELRRTIEAAIARGERIPARGEAFVLTGGRGGTTQQVNDWLTVDNGQIRDIDYLNFLRFVTRTSALKRVPAFDTTANTGNAGLAGENSLFGSPAVEYANFTEFGWTHNEVPGDGSGVDDARLAWGAYVAGPGRDLLRQVRLIDPLAYLNSPADSAAHWYFRHGMLDRDTAFAVPLVLLHALRADASVRDVNFQLAWLRGHAGNYDVREAYAWLARTMAEAGPAGPAGRR